LYKYFSRSLVWHEEPHPSDQQTPCIGVPGQPRLPCHVYLAYLVDCDEGVELPTIEAPEVAWSSLQELFDRVFEMEKQVTASINRLYLLAEESGERSASAMLDWFVSEQIQEEAEARFVLKRLRLAEDNSAALLLLDQQFLEGSALAHVKAGMAIYGGQ
jgi:ferritin